MPLTLVVHAKDAANNTVTSYNSPIYLTFSDSAAIIPANQSLSLNKGVGNFTVYFGSTGTQSVTVSDPNNNTITKTLTVNVLPTHFTIISSPSLIFAGQTVNVVVTALDSQNNVLKSIGGGGFGGSVMFASTDSQARFPTSANLVNGVGTFSIVLLTPGSRTITASNRDFPQMSSATTNAITVSPQPTLQPTPTPKPTTKPTINPTPTTSPSPTPTTSPNSTGIPNSYPTGFASPTSITTPPPLPDIWPQTQIILLAIIIAVCVVVIIIVTVVWAMEKNSKANLTDEQKTGKRKRWRTN